MYSCSKYMLNYASNYFLKSFSACTRVSSLNRSIFDGSRNYLKSVSILKCRNVYIGQTASRNEQILKLKDKIPSDFQLIYKAPMPRYIIITYGITLSFMTIITVNYVLQLALQGKVDIQMVAITPELSVDDTQSIAFAVAFYIFNTLLLRFLSKYCLRVYSNNKGMNYAVFVGPLPLKYNKVKYVNGDIVKTGTFQFLPWKDCYFKLRKKTVILLPEYFRTPSDFDAMFKSKTA